MQTRDDALIFLEYRARFAIAEPGGPPVPGDNPIFVAGRFETTAEPYRWLNATQLVGKGRFDSEQVALIYEVCALR